jgi:hypothetical protein
MERLLVVGGLDESMLARGHWLRPSAAAALQDGAGVPFPALDFKFDRAFCAGSWGAKAWIAWQH